VNSAIREWLNLSVRWFHVFSAILWVGQTYYFTWLDGQFSKAEKENPSTDVPSLWMVHSGGFYKVEKQKTLGVSPEMVRWFRWEAALTWISGMVLLFLVYYLSSGLIDPDVRDMSQGRGILIGFVVLFGGWWIYDRAVRSFLGKSEALFATIAFGMVAAVSWGLLHAFSARAAYLHVGALFGTIMVANVWTRILPAQRKMIKAVAAGAKFDVALSAQAKLRSKHNTFLAVPVVFLMISNHFPVATYGNTYSWGILVALILAGWVAAKFVRSA
jgi:uncharacterized membrane protein